jgi:hypothetical protein
VAVRSLVTENQRKAVSGVATSPLARSLLPVAPRKERRPPLTAATASAGTEPRAMTERSRSSACGAVTRARCGPGQAARRPSSIAEAFLLTDDR